MHKVCVSLYTEMAKAWFYDVSTLCEMTECGLKEWNFSKILLDSTGRILYNACGLQLVAMMTASMVIVAGGIDWAVEW